jgi:hypothetical protein
MIPWVFAALKAHGGSAKLIDVADFIWTNYKREIEANRKLLLTWQYEMRWAATELRKRGLLHDNKTNEPWKLTPKAIELGTP